MPKTYLHRYLLNMHHILQFLILKNIINARLIYIPILVLDMWVCFLRLHAKTLYRLSWNFGHKFLRVGTYSKKQRNRILFFRKKHWKCNLELVKPRVTASKYIKTANKQKILDVKGCSPSGWTICKYETQKYRISL